MPEEVRSAVFGNVGTMITFRVGSYDAEVLEKEFAPVFTMEDLVNLGQFQIYLKLMIDNVASQPFSAITTGPIPKPGVSFKEEVVDNSRKAYAKPKVEVEKIIKEWHSNETEDSKIVLKNSNSNDKEKPKFESFRERPAPKKENNVPTFSIKDKVVEKTEVPPKNNSLAKAIEEAVKAKQNGSAVIEENNVNKKIEIKPEIKIEPKKETIPLSALNGDGKNKNKEATLENKNALKEALKQVVANQPVRSVNEKVSIEEKKETRNESSKAPSSEGSGRPKEVPEETLRKILKGE
jgi:hypothetical protein